MKINAGNLPLWGWLQAIGIALLFASGLLLLSLAAIESFNDVHVALLKVIFGLLSLITGQLSRILLKTQLRHKYGQDSI